MEILAWLTAIAGSYLLGSVSFAVVVSRLLGLADPRSYGSGNPGATNVLRSGSKMAAAVTLFGDAAKGAAAVLLVRWLGQPFGIGEAGAALAGLAAFTGHLFPVFFGFRGGKGVATFLGALLAIDALAGLVACLTWLAMAMLLRYSSLASLSAALAAPVALLWSTGNAVSVVVVAVMSALLVARHRSNIANLLAGRERRIGEKARTG